MSDQDKRHRAVIFMLTLAAFIVVIAGMKASAPIVIQLILAVFLAVICSGPFLWLRKRRVPSVLAIVLVVLGIFVIFGLIGTLLGTSIAQFVGKTPEYKTTLSEKMQGTRGWLEEKLPFEISGQAVLDAVDPGAALNLMHELLSGVTSTFTQILVIVLIVIFILAEVTGFPVKVRAALGEQSAFLDRFQLFTKNLMRYFGIKTLISLATGVAVGLWVLILGLDFPVLLGFLAFLLNFIPNVGSILAALPAILLALIQFDIGMALLTAGGYVGINMSISLLEPRFMGRGLGLSALSVFLSLIFWGWVFGPIGMIISVPLTMTLKIALDTFEETRWLAFFLGTECAAREAAERDAGCSPGRVS